MQAAEARVLQAEQDTSPSQTSPPEFAKLQPETAKQPAALVGEGGTTSPLAETAETVGRREQLCTISSELL